MKNRTDLNLGDAVHISTIMYQILDFSLWLRFLFLMVRQCKPAVVSQLRSEILERGVDRMVTLLALDCIHGTFGSFQSKCTILSAKASSNQVTMSALGDY